MKFSGVGHLEEQSGGRTRDWISQWWVGKGRPEDRDAEATLHDGEEWAWKEPEEARERGNKLGKSITEIQRGDDFKRGRVYNINATSETERKFLMRAFLLTTYDKDHRKENKFMVKGDNKTALSGMVCHLMPSLNQH